MSEWWEGLSTLLKVLYCIAAPSTLILLIQTIMSLFGFHEGGMGTDISDTSGLDLDASGLDMGGADLNLDVGDVSEIGSHCNIDHTYIDGGNPSDFASMQMFTLQTIVAFLTVFSWTSIVGVNSGMPPVLAILLGCALGFLTMFMLAKIIQLSAKLAENGTLNLRNCIGEDATVYYPIPAKGDGEGKVTLTVQGRFVEISAISKDDKIIKTGSLVRVTDLHGDCVVVEKD